MYANAGSDDIPVKPILSICIPTYNRSSALDSCLFSICSQLFWENLPLEIIISDNASSDDTESVAKKWAARFNQVRYYRNNENIGGTKNFWKVTEYVNTPFFWFMGDDGIFIPGTLRHVVDILLANPNTSLMILSGTNNRNDQTEPLNGMVSKQGCIVRAMDKNEFISSFDIQTLGSISCLLFSTEHWRKTGYNLQPQYSLYPQIRSVLEVAAMNGDLLFSNKYCSCVYRADHNTSEWYFDKAPVSIVVEFQWLRNYAKTLGFNMTIKGGLHNSNHMWKIKQWLRMLLSHPYYVPLYKEALTLEPNIFVRITMLLMLPITMVSPLARNILAKKHIKFPDSGNNTLYKSA